ncbi:MAG TPA: hypothetical protein VMC85_06950 [Desulfomonilaceae bacterium]|nr:hypothetical protein [Desulfomonilaceae bacterium]
MHAIRLTYTKRPRMLPLYARGMLQRRSGLVEERTLPAMQCEWRGFKIDRRHLKRFTDICRLAPSDTMPLVFPLVFAFPLHVAMVCQAQFPLSYVRMMQIWNHVIQHRPVNVQETIDVSCVVVGQRVAAKGLEMDVYTVLEAGGDAVWESIHTYYFPGSFGEPDQPSQLSDLPLLPDNSVEKIWKMPHGSGFRFGLMAGDYNPIHYVAPYARLMGFRRDFAHAQRTLALCLQHLPAFAEDQPVRLDVSIKGPVYYGSKVTMKVASDTRSHRFDLFCEDDPRPCIRGSLSSFGSVLDSTYDGFFKLPRVPSFRIE